MERTSRSCVAHLEPSPGQFSLALFVFYIDHAEELDPLISEVEMSRLKALITGSVLKIIGPIEYDLTATAETQGHIMSYNISSNISIFGDALRVTDRLDLDVSEFRQRVLSYVPFAFGDHLRAIFNLIPKITPGEMAQVIDIYNQHKSDLWRHMPGNLIDAVERYHIADGQTAHFRSARSSALLQNRRSQGAFPDLLRLLFPSRGMIRYVKPDLNYVRHGNTVVSDHRTKNCLHVFRDSNVYVGAPFRVFDG